MRLIAIVLASGWLASLVFAAWAIWREAGRRVDLDAELEARATANRRGERLARLLAVSNSLQMPWQCSQKGRTADYRHFWPSDHHPVTPGNHDAS